MKSQRCLIVLGYEVGGDVEYEEIEGTPSMSLDDEELSPANCSWSHEFEVPEGTPDDIITKVGQGYAFMADWTAQDTATRCYRWVDNQWKEV